MKLNNDKELRLFEAAVRKCRNAVMVQTVDGKSYDLKTKFGFVEGIAELLKPCKKWQEAELYINSPEDSVIMYNFLQACPATA